MQRLLRGFRGVAAPHFERIAQEFYDRIRQHEEAHAVFTGEAQIARLQRSLVRWMERLFGGDYDEAYFAEIEQIGRVHVKVGLPQRYMFTAMALIRSVADAARRAPAERRAPRIARATCRRCWTSSWRSCSRATATTSITRIQHVERSEKEALGRSLARTEHRYVNAVELAHVLILGLDVGGVVQLFNREAERVTGFARDEVLGRPLVSSASTTTATPARLARSSSPASPRFKPAPTRAGRRGAARDDWSARGPGTAASSAGTSRTRPPTATMSASSRSAATSPTSGPCWPAPSSRRSWRRSAPSPPASPTRSATRSTAPSCTSPTSRARSSGPTPTPSCSHRRRGRRRDHPPRRARHRVPRFARPRPLQVGR
jgi:PAS domain-containing protein